MTPRLAVGALLSATALAGCGETGSSPTAPPSPLPVIEVPGVVRGPSEGDTALYLVGAEPLPGATVTGCGNGATGCGRRIRMTFRLVSARGGPVPGVLAFLHSDHATACFKGLSGPLEIAPGLPRDVEILFDPADTDQACPTPLEITHVAAVAEGTVTVFARQEWAARYHLVR